MKTLITYYSFSGNTDKVAHIFAEVLKQGGEVDLQRLKPTDEIPSFIGQCMAARAKKRASLPESVIFDVSKYDLIIVGSPVWAFAPVPAINTYLDHVNGLNGKRVISLLTSGSGLGVQSTFKRIRSVLEGKGSASVYEINIPDRVQHDKVFIENSLKKIL